MSVHTRSQKLAQEAFARVKERSHQPDFGDYETVVRKFPALIHTCGLAQAVAFALSKRKKDTRDGGPHCVYVADLAAVLHAGGHGEVRDGDSLATRTRNEPVTTYLRLSRDAIEAAIWLKRYAEALSADVASKTGGKP